ncbi:MAG: alpha/beta fold hydrolase [Anaerolineaceae bacterium]|nr:alpha/beta fold hydrolase [Anaerolineaceae bacterium]
MPCRHEFMIEGHTIVALEYNAHKTGTPAILIHGIMSSVGFWPEEGHIFDEQFHWYSLSLPGHYPAVFPKDFRHEDLSAEMIARVMATAIRQLVGDQPVLLVGHSTGAFAALAVAAQAPEMVNGVISVGGFAEGKWGGLLSLLQRQARMGAAGEAMFRLNVKSGVLHPRMAYYLSSFYAADKRAYFNYPNMYYSIQEQFVYSKHLDPYAMAHYFNRMPDINITEWLPLVKAPTLVISGDKDPIVPATQSALIASKVTNGDLVMVAGAGHMVMMERAAIYSQTINEWVKPFVDVETNVQNRSYETGAMMLVAMMD